MQSKISDVSLREALQERNSALQLTHAMLHDRNRQIESLEWRNREMEEAQLAGRSTEDANCSGSELFCHESEELRRQQAQETVRARVRNEVLRADSEVLRKELADRDLIVEQLHQAESEML